MQSSLNTCARRPSRAIPSASDNPPTPALPAFGFLPVLFACLLCAISHPLPAQPANADTFDFAALQARAAALAAKPYAERPLRVPEMLQRLTYDQYRQIEFKRDHSWWAGEHLPFQLQFFHPGFIQLHTVRINEVAAGRAREIPFSPMLFDYRGARDLIRPGLIPPGMGFSGWRAVCPLNTPRYFDELIVFQGASYFRALSQGARYGLSARGLALNTGEPGGEEFPVFEEFWIEKPVSPGAKSLRFWALLDSPSAAGAYEFTISPGKITTIDVNAVIHRRAVASAVNSSAVAAQNVKSAPKVFGIAPLTSMFWFGKNTRDHPDDLRPEVHDSDGLALHTGAGEWLWRPLDNPHAVRTAAFADEHPRGFGLFQRERNFEAYQDIEAAYHLRPSVWIEPLGDWGRGEIRLVELPTPDETNDNIVAFWTPATLPPAGEPLRIAYRMHWFLDTAPPQASSGAGAVVATRTGRSLTHEPELRRFWVDFKGGRLARMDAGEKIGTVVTVGAGATLANATVEKNPYNNTWRAAFAIRPGVSGAPVELRCYLKDAKGGALTETWSYLWTP